MKTTPLKIIFLSFLLFLFLCLAGSVLAGWVIGKVGSAAQFSGVTEFTDYAFIDVGDVGNIKTVEFWIKTSSSTQEIMDLNGSAYVRISGWDITATGWTSPTIYVDGKKRTAITSNAWHHITITTDTDINASTTVFGKGPNSYFKGTLDEIRFYNRVLSDAEVRFHYNRGAPVIHLKFDEGAGDTAYDSSGQGNVGTISSAVWTAGKYGTALEFSGTSTSYVQVPHSDSLDIIEEITISFWVKPEKPWGCGDTINYGGDIYNTVEIGSQCWLKENLNVINGNTDQSCSITRYCYNDNSANCDTYGGLYTWTHMMCGEGSSNLEPSGVQGICPNGWHLPSHNEWTTLERQICTDLGNADCDTKFPKDESTLGYRGTNEGSAMGGEHDLWASGVLRNDPVFATSGLDVLPGGYRSSAGAYDLITTDARLWTSTSYLATAAWGRGLEYDGTEVARATRARDSGAPVRCVQD